MAALLDNEGFARAAERLFVTPSTFATTIRQLERLTGTSLVERTRQGMRLNARGLEMAGAAAKALREMDGVVRGARKSAATESESLFVQTTPTLAEGIGAELLTSLMATHPALRLSVRSPRRPVVSDIAYAVAAAEIDIGMTERMRRPIDGIVQVPLGAVEIAYAFPANADVRPARATLAHMEKYGLIVVPHFESSDIYAEFRSRTSLLSRFIRARVADRYAFPVLALHDVAGFLCEYKYREELESFGLHVALLEEPFTRRFVTIAREGDRRGLIADVLALSRQMAEINP
jgi:DNA-binding transcriptional LysR family regulator